MTDPKKIALIGAGLVGLYLLSGQVKDAAGGGGFGGGDGEPLGGDVTITFPELDLSQIWGDEGEIKKTVSDPGVEYFQYLKDIGERPTMGEEGDIMALSEFDISQYRTTTKKLPSEPDQRAFALPFFGATGAPTFSSWLKTHNLFGKRIAGATAPPPSLMSSKKAISSVDGGNGSSRAWLRSVGLDPLKAKVVHSSPKITPFTP